MTDTTDEFVFKITAPPAKNVGRFDETLDQRLKINAFMKKLKEADAANAPRPSKKEEKKIVPAVGPAPAANLPLATTSTKTSTLASIIHRIKRQVINNIINLQQFHRQNQKQFNIKSLPFSEKNVPIVKRNLQIPTAPTNHALIVV
jgi:hypothetical protein